MTQAQPDRIDWIEAFIERMDRKLDAIAADLVAVKISQAKAEERFNTIDERFKSVDTQLLEIKDRLKSQDARLWGFVAILSVAVIGFLGKLAFFPDVKV
jgi:septation ring formation regulator EzrA